MTLSDLCVEYAVRADRLDREVLECTNKIEGYDAGSIEVTLLVQRRADARVRAAMYRCCITDINELIRET